MKKTAILGMYLAFAMILSYIESMIPMPFPIPGIKLGMANLATILILYLYSWREALLISLMRVFLTGFLFTNVSMILYSLAGAIVSLTIMTFARRTHLFSIQSISLLGGISHNLGQVLVAFLTVRTYGVLYYIPFLFLSGAVTGYIIGILGSIMEPCIRHAMKNSSS